MNGQGISLIVYFISIWSCRESWKEVKQSMILGAIAGVDNTSLEVSEVKKL